jgi:predicted dehydrogenase
MFWFNRREFLTHSAAATAALAALGTRTAARAADEPKPERPTSPSEKLRVAVVGVHGRGMSHVGGFNNSNGCEIVTICDCDEGVIGKAMSAVEKKRGKAPRYEKDIRKVVEDKSIDIISIATPNHWHALAAIWAMQNGKDVYVEKPVSHNVREGRVIVEVARKTGRICQAGTQSRSMRGMRDAIAYVQSGKLGKVKLAYATCYKPRPSIGDVGRREGDQQPPKTMDYNLWCGPAPVIPPRRNTKDYGTVHYHWHWIWAYGNGDLGNQGIHEMDKARWGLNKNELPKSVLSLGGRFGYIDDGETANTQLCLFDYGDSELIFEVRGLRTNDYKGAKVGNIFFGTEGIVVCPNYSSGILLDPQGKKIQEFTTPKGEGEESHFGNFVKAVRSRKKEDLRADIEEGHLSSALCHLGNISYRLGKETAMSAVKDFTDNKDALEAFERMRQHLVDNNVDLDKAIGHVGPLLHLDPKAERFAGNNTAANQMLTREYRQGFEVPAKG